MADRAPRKTAAAVRYDPSEGEAGPQLVAAGEGYNAQRILDLAAEHGIPVREDPMLASALAQLADSTDIPPDLYVAVAQALVWAWETDRNATKLKAAGHQP